MCTTTEYRAAKGHMEQVGYEVYCLVERIVTPMSCLPRWLSGSEKHKIDNEMHLCSMRTMEQQIFSSIDCQERFFAIRGFLGISEPDLLWAANVPSFH